MRTIAIRLAVAAVLVGLVAAGFAWRAAHHPPAPPAAPEAAAPAAPASTGSYADDWQAKCAPIVGPAQTECTRALDAQYGRTTDAPVPPLGK